MGIPLLLCSFANYIFPDKIFVVPQIFIPRRDRKALNEIACKGITPNFHFARVVNIVLIRGFSKQFIATSLSEMEIDRKS